MTRKACVNLYYISPPFDASVCLLGFDSQPYTHVFHIFVLFRFVLLSHSYKAAGFVGLVFLFIHLLLDGKWKSEEFLKHCCNLHKLWL